MKIELVVGEGKSGSVHNCIARYQGVRGVQQYLIGELDSAPVVQIIGHL